MTLPDSVATAWNAFAHAVDVSSLQEADYANLALVAVALESSGLSMIAIEEPILEVGGRNGAPEFLAGELMAGVDVGVRAVAAHKAGVSAAAAKEAAAAAEAAKVAEEAARAAEAAAKAAEAKSAALSKLSDEEKKALGLA
jgi:hypothetical protein